MIQVKNEFFSPRFCAFFDILGFKFFLKDQGPLFLANVLEKILNENYKYHSPEWNLDGVVILNTLVEYIVFSDSIVLLSRKNSLPNDFYLACNQLFSFFIWEKIPLRGGISFGNIYYNNYKNILIGQPVIDAYNVEGNQKWIGCSFHKSCFEYDNTLKHPLSHSIHYFPYKIPVKGNRVGTVNIALAGWARDKNILSRLKDLKRFSPIDSHLYYQNTIDFVKLTTNYKKSARYMLDNGYLYDTEC
ncbi:MAG: hypothetical protein CVV44_10315 [Spirochaetae bacterium HGW-Spirochaetae-1]|jgi:hypothetical protein|nr:MAG: hypothetical protein CVV44_10315 [Spirochaetae bacterium HGW-Spirochaetae-1]